MQHKLICEHAPGWLDALQDEIASIRNTRPDAHVFALLDCAFAESTYAAILKHGLPSRSLYDLSETPSRDLQAVSPTLIPLTPETAPQWRDVLRLTDGWPMLSLIVTPESLDELALRLSPWCIVNADGQPFVFRFPDTRRLSAIVDVLTPEQHGAFLGPAIAWQYRTRSATWAELPLPVTPLPAADYVKLDAQQYARLISDSEADAIMSHLNVNEPPTLLPYHPAAAHELVSRALKRADRYGIADADRIQWCSLYLKQPKLEQMGAAIPLLTALLAKECRYADIRTELTNLVRTHDLPN
jgi:hypothetical protein